MRHSWLLAAVVLAGCSKQAEKVPSCAELTEHLFAVTKIAYPGHGDMEMGNRQLEIANCEARKPTPEERRCIMAAKDLAAVTTCRRKALEKAGKSQPSGAPAGAVKPPGTPMPTQTIPAGSAAKP